MQGERLTKIRGLGAVALVFAINAPSVGAASPQIKEVLVDFASNPKTITITGSGFSRDHDATIGTYPELLTVLSVSNTEMVVVLPDDVSNRDYLLALSSTPTFSCLDGKPTSRVFAYAGGLCGASRQTQSETARCEDFARADHPGAMVDIMFSKDPSQKEEQEAHNESEQNDGDARLQRARIGWRQEPVCAREP